jgi:hypothetical protein
MRWAMLILSAVVVVALGGPFQAVGQGPFEDFGKAQHGAKEAYKKQFEWEKKAQKEAEKAFKKQFEWEKKAQEQAKKAFGYGGSPTPFAFGPANPWGASVSPYGVSPSVPPYGISPSVPPYGVPPVFGGYPGAAGSGIFANPGYGPGTYGMFGAYAPAAPYGGYPSYGGVPYRVPDATINLYLRP